LKPFLILAVGNNEMESHSIDIYQSYPQGDSFSPLDNHAIPIAYHPADENSLYEFDLFKKIHSIRRNSGAMAPWGLISSRFSSKASIPLNIFRAFAGAQFAAGSDAVFINPFFDSQAMFFSPWEQGRLTHGQGFEDIFNWCLKEGLIQCHAISGIHHFSLANYFLANDRFWAAYLNFADRLLELITQAKDTNIHNIANGSGYYPPKPQATMRVFIMERLFSQFIFEHGEFKCTSYPVTRNWVVSKYGPDFGEIFLNLSEIKNRAIRLKDTIILNQWHQRRQEVNSLVFGSSN
jgi:hypothetical protein